MFEWKNKELSIIIIKIFIFLKESMFEFCLNLHFTRMFYFFHCECIITWLLT